MRKTFLVLTLLSFLSLSIVLLTENTLAAIGTPVERYQANLGAQTATTTFSPTTNTTQGTTLILMLGTGNAGSNKVASSVSDDTGGNTWQVDKKAGNTNGVSIASVYLSKALSTTSVVTITWNNANSAASQVSLQEVSGLASTSYLDKTSSASSTSVTPSSTSGVLAQRDEIIFAALRYNGSPVLTLGNGWNAVTTDPINTALGMEYQIVSASSSLNADFTLSVANVWSEVVATYQAPLRRIRGVGISR